MFSPSRVARRTRPTAAFTLVEILVVCAIIAILAALIFPQIGRMTNRGHQTASIKNLREWGGAFNAYTSENAGVMPHSGNGVPPSEDSVWVNALPLKLSMPRYKTFIQQAELMPKRQGKSIWFNPAAPEPPATATGFYFHYGMNDKLVDNTGQPLVMANLLQTDLTILLGEINDTGPVLNRNTVRAYFGSRSKDDPLTAPENEANFLFLNGVVKSFPRKTFADDSLSNDINIARQNRTTITYLPILEQ